MDAHEIIVLEDAPSPSFLPMLEGRLSIEEYVMESDSGFPEFERRMCVMLRELCEKGKRIVQSEPFLERLLRIHHLLADGKTPEDVEGNPDLAEVYTAEKNATGALLKYYVHSLKSPFDQVVEAVKRFAKADAERLRLRSLMRAQAIKSLFPGDGSIYVEAGYIHFPLYIYLKRALGPGVKIRVVHLLSPVIQRLGGVRRNMGPGDILTLYYVLHGRIPKDVANLLAGRSLIHIKLLQKDELLPGASEAPHAEDTVKVNRMVDPLSMEACRTLFDRIRRTTREEALERVEAFRRTSG
jgi:hypothetical protein